MGTNDKQNKGIISELVALTYLARLPNTIVFQASLKRWSNRHNYI
jgi:hypothetical protein